MSLILREERWDTLLETLEEEILGYGLDFKALV